ncbi:MAG: hypothetical protein KDC92_01585 [Bacteroidetes bacterium]|nr:hypothetical protein [Bacteroidota bacterium]
MGNFVKLIGLFIAVWVPFLAISQQITATDHSEFDSLHAEYFYAIDHSPDSALELINNLYAKALLNNDYYEIGYALCLKGEAYAMKNELEMAGSFFHRALDLFTEHNDSMGKGYAFHGLGTIADNLGRYEDAIAFYKLGLEYDTTLIDDVFIAWFNIARDYIYLDSTKKALPYINQLKRQFKRGEDSSGYYLALELETDIKYENGNYKDCLKPVMQCVVFYKKLGYKAYLASLYYYLCNIYAELEDLEKAKFYLNKGLHIETVLMQSEPSYYYYDMAIHLAKLNGDYQAAFNAMLNQKKLTKKSKNVDNSSLFKVVEQEYEFREKIKTAEREKELLAKEKQAEKKAFNAARNYFRLVIALVAFIAIILAFLFYKLRKLNSQLRVQNSEIEKSNTQLTESNKLKEKLMGLIAHDTRNPLAATSSGLQLINSGHLSKEEEKLLINALATSSERSLEELDGVIRWAKAQLDGMNVELKTVKLENLMNEILVSIQPIFQEKGIEFISKFTPICQVKADEQLLKHAIKNLMVNAGKFSHPNDKVTVGADINNGTCKIYVSDNGVGMNESQLESLFSASSVSFNGTKNEKGTGLGLIQCKEFVTNMGGTISVTSALNKGTTFTITLPSS